MFCVRVFLCKQAKYGERITLPLHFHFMIWFLLFGKFNLIAFINKLQLCYNNVPDASRMFALLTTGKKRVIF